MIPNKSLISDKKIMTCVSTLFVALSALGFSSYWILHPGDQKTLAISVHIFLILSTFVLVAFTASRNHRLRNTQLQQKTQAQNILYDMVVSINSCRDLKELLNRFCDDIYKTLSANNVSVWLITEQNWLEYIVSTGIDPKVITEQKRIKIDDDLSSTLTNNKILHSNKHVTQLAEVLQCDISEDDKSYYIPLHHGKNTVGLIRIKISEIPFNDTKDFEDLLNYFRTAP